MRSIKYSLSILLLTSLSALSADIKVRSITGTQPRDAETNTVTFDYQIGDPLPTPEMYSITSTGAGSLPVSMRTSGQPWLDVYLSSPVTPAVLTIGLNGGQIPEAGTYTGTVTVDSANNTLTWFVFLTVKASTGAPSGNLLLPQFVCGSGWTTTLYLTNTAVKTQAATVYLQNNGGTGLTVAGSSVRSPMINPHGSAVLSFGKSVCPGTLVDGYLKVNLPVGMIGYAVFGQNGQEAVVPVTKPGNAAVLPFDDTQSTTSIAITSANLPKTPFEMTADFVDMTAYDLNGAVIGTVTVSIFRDNKVAFALRDRLPQVAGKVGSVVLKSTWGQFGALGLRFTAGGSAFTSIPVQ